MNFIITDASNYDSDYNNVYLKNNNWDDWFEFETLYEVYYLKKYIGSIKIGRKGQNERRASLPESFECLPEGFFSLGINTSYYANLKSCDKRIEILMGLKDVAYDLDLFNEIVNQRVTQVSLLRDISKSTVKGQFHRIADGGAVLTDYDFKYILPDIDFVTGEKQSLDFHVDAENNTPSSNIHVFIGNNGIGKTTIIKGILHALLFDDEVEKYGVIETGWGETFSNIVNITFSVFDDPICQGDIPNNKIPYTYIGLIYAQYDEDGNRNKYAKYNQLSHLFFESYYQIIKSNIKKELWNRSIDILQSDSTFKDLNIKDWNKYTLIREKISKEIDETETQYKNRVEREYYKTIVYEKFSYLSSGHKNILLTLVSLVNYVEEKTLVILDEPEEHLHPPLVAAFIRALSVLLTYRNGVAIIATHSPVIVQEVPKKCVWKIRRKGKYRIFDRPEIETFGENLGELTTEIFSYDVEKSGFHALLKQASEKANSYDEALSSFNGELGNEAKSILRAYMYDKENAK
ncbi:AAA family ATPase [Clostridium hydrogenum]|uniref:AAA family ATPase n=1 Tax=Clostridium hydrogenum TaxID=2855764 RepID=UPI001F407468|nr:AAA family ATPase [Clostridium hydrogenum]